MRWAVKPKVSPQEGCNYMQVINVRHITVPNWLVFYCFVYLRAEIASFIELATLAVVTSVKCLWTTYMRRTCTPGSEWTGEA